MNAYIIVLVIGFIAIIAAAVIALRRENRESLSCGKAEVAVHCPVHSIEQRARRYATSALPNSFFTKRRTKARRKAGATMLRKAPRDLRRALSSMYGI